MDEEEKKVVVSHARRFLLNLIDDRKLNSWCEENNISHTTVYSLAMGTVPPTYQTISKLLPYIEPAKWFYPENMKIPYKMRKLPEIKTDEICSFVKKHRTDYKEIAEKYGLQKGAAQNIFVNYRTKPPVMLIAKACNEVNPEEFFIAAKPEDSEKFFPDRGDIVSVSGKSMLVLSKVKTNKKNNMFLGVCFADGKADLSTFASLTYAWKVPEITGKVDEETVKSVLKEVRDLLK